MARRFPSVHPFRRDPGRGLSASFQQLWIGKSAASLSDFAVASALPILAALISGSPRLVAAVSTALTLPWLLFGLTAGALVDRVDRRHALLAAAFLRLGVFSLAALLAATGHLPDAALLVVAITTGISQVVTETATISLTPQLVAVNQLEPANARLLTAELVVETAAVLVAGTLASGGVSTVCATGALCALAGLLALRRLARTAPGANRQPGQTAARVGLLEGIRLLWTTPVLRAIALIGAVINTAWTAFAATFVLYAIEPGPIGLSAQRYSLLLTASVGGGIIGAFFAARTLGRVGNRWGIGLNIIANAVTFAAPVITASPLLIGAIFFVGDSASPLWRVATATLQQRSVPEQLRGRVVAAYRLISFGAATAGPAIGVAIAGQIGQRGLFAAATLTCLLMLLPFHRTITDEAIGRLLSTGESTRERIASTP